MRVRAAAGTERGSESGVGQRREPPAVLRAMTRARAATCSGESAGLMDGRDAKRESQNSQAELRMHWPEPPAQAGLAGLLAELSAGHDRDRSPHRPFQLPIIPP